MNSSLDVHASCGVGMRGAIQQFL